MGERTENGGNRMIRRQACIAVGVAWLAVASALPAALRAAPPDAEVPAARAERPAPESNARVSVEGGANPFLAQAGTEERGSSRGFLEELLEAASEEPEFLHPDRAFRVGLEVRGPEEVVFRWRIEPGYYLYRKRIELAVEPGDVESTAIAGVAIPPGEVVEDPYFGTVEIFREAVTVPVRLAHAGAPPPEVALAVAYQGCADQGLCYPPVWKVFSAPLDGPGPGFVAVTDDSRGLRPSRDILFSEDQLSETDRIARSLSADGLLFGLAAFFGFGLLLAFPPTPCVFPMIPILSSILVAQGRPGTGRSFLLSAAYVSSSAATYALIGAMAGLAGANLQIAFQHPGVIGVVGAVFVLLALAMFGLYELQVPSSWQTRLSGWGTTAGRAGGYTAASVMGVVSALVVGPCVAAPLAGAVLYIGEMGDPARGGLVLFALGLGMGAPLLLLGASTGRWLPRAGRWMEAAKKAAGVVLLGVAALLFERVAPAWLAMAGWAAVAGSAGLVLAFAARHARALAARRAAGYGAGAAAVYAAVLVLGAATGAADPLRPFDGIAAPAGAEALEFRAIKGVDGPDGLDAALIRAATDGRSVMLDFYADWCVTCKEMEDTTFRDARVVGALRGALMLRADVTANDEADRALMRRLGVLGPPAILFFGPDRVERRRFRTVGFQDAEEFSARAARAMDAA